jgi:hypothetical protein
MLVRRRYAGSMYAVNYVQDRGGDIADVTAMSSGALLVGTATAPFFGALTDLVGVNKVPPIQATHGCTAARPSAHCSVDISHAAWLPLNVARTVVQRMSVLVAWQ